eukprot:CAMPEP_0170196506 /NCGR_PEP_ID=MMETSP0040_2-20121228/64110_1 /TAXON_ID=641309 /ORGANISM="Lotharella oceanica, Strain CCMP622" /LENGTH=59 /DNA_ID=CAMNT_0010445933 /DNA_START=521 /DNA_END=696 /DNA_ORIENTATION=-
MAEKLNLKRNNNQIRKLRMLQVFAVFINMTVSTIVVFNAANDLNSKQRYAESLEAYSWS